MDTKILSLEDGIKIAADLIIKGEVVAFPTETVYGLAANAYDESAVKKIFEAKGRPQDNPLIVHLAKKTDIPLIAASVSKKAQMIIDAFMPGPITVVLKKSDKISKVVTAGLDSVGIRIPASKDARSFIEATGVPIAAPSANLSSKISPTTAMHVYNDLKGRINLILDGGPCDVGIESTVVDLSGEEPIILRPGYITEEDIKKVLLNTTTYHGSGIEHLPSPGMRYKHYAPSVPAICIKGLDNIKKEYNKKKSEGLNTVVIARDITLSSLPSSFNTINLGNKEKDYAKNIYKSMHDAEVQYDYIIIEYLDDGLISSSVMNRVLKSVSGNVIK